MEKKILTTKLEKMDFCIVFMCSILIMLIQIRFNGHAFLVDDNAIQWYPIVEKVYSSFIKTGRLAFYDFFQMKGMIIGDEGYYGQTNPVLFLSWVLTKLFFHGTDCICMYAIMCVAIGNLAWNGLLKRMRYSLPVRILVIVLETTVSAFIWFGNWYYIFNSYLIIPLLLLAIHSMLNKESKEGYFMGGLVLFFSITLGNVQYTFYHYLMYGIVLSIFIVFSRRFEKVKYLIGNIVIGVILSLPLLMNQLSAGSRREGAVFDEHFFAYAVTPLKWILNAFIPVGVLSGSEGLMNAAEYGHFSQQFMPAMYLCVLAFLIMGIVKTISFIKEKCLKERMCEYGRNGGERLLSVAVFCCIVFFWLFQAGKGFVVADVMHLMPVVNQFRWLYKMVLIIAPMTAVIAAFVIDRYWQGKKRYLIAVGTIIFGFIGMWNNMQIMKGQGYWLYNEDFRKEALGIFEYDKLWSEFEANGIDLRNYRMLGMSADMDTYGEDHFEPGLIPSNLPTLFGMYALGGFEPAPTLFNYSSVGEIFLLPFFDYSVSGQVMLLFFMEQEGGEQILAEYTIPQMINNSVKYCIFRKDSPYRESFRRIIEENYALLSVRETELSNGMIVYSFENVPRLCDGAELINDDIIDQLHFRFDTDNAGENLLVRFSYSDDLKAYYVKNGTKKNITLQRDESGDILIDCNEDMKGSDLYIKYGNVADHAVLYYGMLVSILVLILMVIRTIGDKEFVAVNSKTDPEAGASFEEQR